MLLTERLFAGRVPTATGLFVEGALAASVACAGAIWLFPEHTSIVSIFLCAIGSLGSVERELEWNRAQIVEHHQDPRRINAVFTGRVLALFFGQLVTFSFVALFASPSLVATAFDLQLGNFHQLAFPDMTFPPALHILGHNLGVLSLFFALALLFRHGGALLAVAWNASVWGVVFGTLARTWTAAGGPGLVEAYARVMAGVFVHMALEALAYTIVAFAGVFLAKALTNYQADNARWTSLLKTIVAMMVGAVLLFALGSAWEGWLAPPLVDWLSR